MTTRQPLYLCMGSACHQAGAWKLIPLLEEALRSHGLADKVELKGSFCLETCVQGLSIQFGDHINTDISADNIDRYIRLEVIPRLETP